MHKDIGAILVTATLAIFYGLSQYFKQKPVQGLSAFQRSLVNNNRRLAYLFFLQPIILSVRIFIIAGYWTLGGSLNPTLFSGELFLTNKLAYGVRLPMIGTQLTAFKSPKRGDMVVYYSPFQFASVSERIVGLPGDYIQYHQGLLTINGKLMPQRIIKTERFIDKHGRNNRAFLVSLREENLAEHKHLIYTYIAPHMKEPRLREEINTQHLKNIAITVPKDHYFVMNDNRDVSSDSRHYGCIPASHILGQAKWILFSWNSQAPWSKPLEWVRWERIGKKIV